MASTPNQLAFTVLVIFNFILIPTCISALEIESTPTYCPAANKSTPYGAIVFPQTLATEDGQQVRVECPNGFLENGLQPISDFTVSFESHKGIAQTKQKEESGAFGYCRLQQSASNHVMEPTWELESKPGVLDIRNCRTTGSAVGAQRAKKSLNVPVITPQNYKQILSDIHFLTYYAKGDYEVAQIFVDGMGRLLSTPDLFEGQQAVAGDLFRLLDSFTSSIYIIPGYKVTVKSPHVTVQTTQFPYNNNSSLPLVNYSTMIDNVQLNFPSEIIQKGVEQNLTEPKLRITAYSEDVLFHWKEREQESISTTAKITIGTTSTSISTATTVPASTHQTTQGNQAISTFKTTPTTTTNSPPTTTPLPSTTESPRTSLGNWRIFSIELVDAVVQNLSQEFEFTYTSTVEEVQANTWTCVYWNETEKVWSTDGMESSVENDKIKCKSTHFTAFSVLISPLPLPIPGSDYAPIQNTVHSDILSIISSIGSAISIVGLFGVILTYGLFRSLRRERSNRILLNLSVALLLMHLFSISSSKSLWDGHCLIPAMCLQYFLHSSLFWMLMEAYHMHQLLISVFVKPESRFILKRSLIAWGIPLLIVSICATIKPQVYMAGRYDTCIIAAHLSYPLYYVAYMFPVILILTINFCVFCRIFKVLYKQNSKQAGKQVGKTKAKVDNNNEVPELTKKVAQNLKKKYVMLSPTQIKGSLTVMLLVGVGWVVGLFAIGPFEVFFKYLFCITNAGQGALIFLFRVILHPQACREWRKALVGLNLESLEVSTTSSTNINTNGRKTKMSFSGSPAFISASNSVENSLTVSNPDAKDLANTLATMLRLSEGNKEPRPNIGVF